MISEIFDPCGLLLMGISNSWPASVFEKISSTRLKAEFKDGWCSNTLCHFGLICRLSHSFCVLRILRSRLSDLPSPWFSKQEVPTGSKKPTFCKKANSYYSAVIFVRLIILALIPFFLTHPSANYSNYKLTRYFTLSIRGVWFSLASFHWKGWGLLTISLLIGEWLP